MSLLQVAPDARRILEDKDSCQLATGLCGRRSITGSRLEGGNNLGVCPAWWACPGAWGATPVHPVWASLPWGDLYRAV